MLIQDEAITSNSLIHTQRLPQAEGHGKREGEEQKYHREPAQIRIRRQARV